MSAYRTSIQGLFCCLVVVILTASGAYGEVTYKEAGA